MSLSSSYKPSPLSFGSPRTSPFRRPESPASPSTVIRPSTPVFQSTRPTTPSRLQNATAAIADPIPGNTRTPLSPKPRDTVLREVPLSPTKGATIGGKAERGELLAFSTPRTTGRNEINSNNLAKLPPAQVREMREAFQILDRDSDGQVTREDVAEMLKSFGFDTAPPSLTTCFSSSVSYPLSLSTYLSTLSALLAPLSHPSELVAAFAAFDDDDSGQICVKELQDALLHTAPEAGEKELSKPAVESIMEAFRGRREFGGFANVGGGKVREEVFRYREFVANLGGAAISEGESEK